MSAWPHSLFIMHEHEVTVENYRLVFDELVDSICGSVEQRREATRVLIKEFTREWRRQLVNECMKRWLRREERKARKRKRAARARCGRAR